MNTVQIATVEVTSIVKDFAKANKVSIAKAQAFAAQIAAVSKPKHSLGRKASAETVEFRNKVKQLAAEGKLPEKFTVKDLMQLAGGEAAMINNTLRYLSQTEGLFKPTGKKEKQAGERGRSEGLWSVVTA